jgi:uncharacterized protein YbjT (DUF2867 family)
MKYAVTGAFGYSGKYIARRLLDAGHTVITLTHSPQRPHPFGDQIRAYPFNFDQPQQLVTSLRGVDVLVNTYWVRFDYKAAFSHARAVDHTRALFRAAQEAGVRRVVHVSITNPDIDSPLDYFSGKAQLEQDLIGSGLSYAILRPAVLFGLEDVLINNIAWALRRLPVFGVFGDGTYRLQPICVDDFARIAVEQSTCPDNTITNAIGPETFTYRELVRTLGAIIGKRRPVIGVPPRLGYAIGWGIGRLMGDVMITWPEVAGLMAELLYVDAPPAGETRLTAWARDHADRLGQRYASELARRR